MPASFSSSTYSPDQLIAGELPPKSRKVTLAEGQTLTRGAVLGTITADGTVALSLAAATDGSETPTAILAEDCDAANAATECLIYERGDFNASAVTLGTGHTIASIREGLRAKGIYFVAVG